MSLLENASLVITPNGYKEGKIYAVKPTDGSGDLTVARASTKTRVNPSGLVTDVPYNLLTYSEDFSNASWSKLTGASIDSNVLISPDGTLNASKLNFSTSINSRIQKAVNVTSNTNHTFSFWAKADASKIIGVKLGVGGDLLIPITITTEWQRFEITSLVLNSTFPIYPQIASVDTLGGFVYIWGAQLTQGTDLKPYFKTTDRLNVPSIDYTGGGCPSILVEPQRTNLVTYSEQFDNAVWNKTSVTVTPNAVSAPNGNLTADLFTSTSSDSYVRYLSFNGIAGTTYTFSFYAKANSSTDIRIRQYNATEANGTIEFITITNEWKRFTVTSACLVNQQVQLWIGGAGTFSTGENFYIWGAQLEAGSYATSYIPTTTAAVTRVADVVSKTGISGLINSKEGVLFVEMSSISNSITTSVMSISDGTNQNTLYFGYSNTSNQLQAQLIVGGIPQATFSHILPDRTEFNRIAILYSNLNHKLFVNGSLVGTNVSGITPPSSTFTSLKTNLGQGSFPFYGKIKQLQLFPTAISDSELIQLTTP